MLRAAAARQIHTFLARGDRSPRLYAPGTIDAACKKSHRQNPRSHLDAFEIHDAADIGINGREVVEQANLEGALGCFAKTGLAAAADSRPTADRHNAKDLMSAPCRY
jgi:hypothetical protein